MFRRKRKPGKIEVINLEGKQTRPIGLHYVGRNTWQHNGSALGNPYILQDESDRRYVLSRYYQWIIKKLLGRDEAVTKEFMSIVARVIKGEDVILGCWCAPKACHADIIKELAELLVVWFIELEKISGDS